MPEPTTKTMPARTAEQEKLVKETTVNMTLEQQAERLKKNKDVPMTYSEMRERFG